MARRMTKQILEAYNRARAIYDAGDSSALEDQGGLFASGAIEMAVQAVVRDVQFAALEPLYLRLVEVILQDPVPLLVPCKILFGHLGPEVLRVLDGPFVELFVLFHTLYMCIFREFLAWREHPRFAGMYLDPLFRH